MGLPAGSVLLTANAEGHQVCPFRLSFSVMGDLELFLFLAVL